MSSDIQELEASLRQQEVVREQETPAEEIARLKEASQADHHFNVDREVQQGTAVGCVTHQTKWANNITGNLFSKCLPTKQQGLQMVWALNLE